MERTEDIISEVYVAKGFRNAGGRRLRTESRIMFYFFYKVGYIKVNCFVLKNKFLKRMN